MSVRTHLCALWWGLALTSGAFILVAQEDVATLLARLVPYVTIEAARHGKVNWGEQVVQADGYGPLAPDAGGRELVNARRIAITDARRNLAEMVAGVRVTAETFVRNYMLERDVVRTQVAAFLQGAAVVAEKPDREKGEYRVTLQVPLSGVRSLNEILLPVVSGPEETASTGGFRPAAAGGGEITGVIFDLRHLNRSPIGLPLPEGTEPCLYPQILDEGGEVVYGLKVADPEVVRLEGLVLYFRELVPPAQTTPTLLLGWSVSVEAAEQTISRAQRRVGRRPVVVRGLRAVKRTNIVISAQDAARLRRANAATGLLRRGRVLIIQDSAVGAVKGCVPFRWAAIL
ncbi:MAG TPA: hypothetical protein EYP85_16640 [Armatimonadetes bacterium]|nr:hypothetical protein [Armatimonadota bacterium]